MTRLGLNWFAGVASWGVVLAGIGLLSISAQAQRGQRAMVGKNAPEFHVQGIYNENYSLESFKGHILVMQFGASW